MAWRKILLSVSFISAATATLTSVDAADRRRVETTDTSFIAPPPTAPPPGYFGTFGPNAYDYEPAGYGSEPPYGYGFPPYGFGCLQRTVVWTLFGPRVRRVWVCN